MTAASRQGALETGGSEHRSGFPRRSLLAWSAGLLLPLTTPVSAAEPDAYPTQPVRIVVGWPAGGYTDALARAFAARLSERWKQSVVVDNRPGASEIIGAAFVANAKPDGTTLFLTTDQALQSNEYLYSKLPYSPSKSFAPIIRIATAPGALLVRADSPYQNLQQIVDAARRAPKKLTYGSNGAGAHGHLRGSLFASRAGIEMTHVPYKGSAPAQQALLSGEIDMLSNSLGSFERLVEAGRLRALAVTSLKRVSTLPDVPTFAELGYAVDVQNLYSFVAPAGTNAQVVAKVAREVKDILAEPAFRRQYIESFGSFVVADDPKTFAEFLAADAPRVRALIGLADVKLD